MQGKYFETDKGLVLALIKNVFTLISLSTGYKWNMIILHTPRTNIVIAEAGKTFLTFFLFFFFLQMKSECSAKPGGKPTSCCMKTVH